MPAFASLPISDQIDSNMLATLQGVTTGNGYQITLDSVAFPDPSGELSPADMMCVLHVGDDQEEADSDTPLQFKQWRRPYAIQIYILKSVAVLGDTRFETWKNVVRAEIEKALLVDVNRGNLAEYTEVHNPITFEDANDAQGIFVMAEVVYRTIYTNPYSQNQT